MKQHEVLKGEAAAVTSTLCVVAFGSSFAEIGNNTLC
jgi:hypothetical protein